MYQIDFRLNYWKNIGYSNIRLLASTQMLRKLNLSELNDNRLDEQDLFALVDGKQGMPE